MRTRRDRECLACKCSKQSSKRLSALGDEEISKQENESEDEKNTETSGRRAFLQYLAIASAMAPVTPVLAAKAEYDKRTGELYTPKAEMLSGGSAAARGKIMDSPSSSQQTRLKPGQALQNVYDTRFITYLSRFLLNFDPAANAWWVQNLGGSDGAIEANRAQVDATFAAFAESVEIGLTDYFVGPYGSYSSLKAATAGISASRQAKSARPNDPQGLLGWMGDFFLGKTEKEIKAKDRDNIAKQGILNLYSLLKARYTTVSAKRQLAILFSFFSNSNLQPTPEIRSLLGEADNATITTIDVIRPLSSSESSSRTSSRRGGGYGPKDAPEVLVEPPPALGSSFQPAKATALMQPTSRVLRIKVTDGGEGYTEPPEVYFSSSGQRQCSACALLDREGHVESILVLDPGYGYGKQKSVPPKVVVAPPKKGKKSRRATAVAELEYEIVGLEVTEGGNGYVATEPPKVTITPPMEDPDWFLDQPELVNLQSEFGPLRAEVVQMNEPNGDMAYSFSFTRPPVKMSFERIRNEALELLPSAVRPELNSLGCYIIPPVAAIPTYGISRNPRYRAVDPIFGTIGTVPVTKSAVELKPSEYGRLALSGAVCTVLVRTALNPLELIKTKQQLQNDEELLTFANERMNNSSNTGGTVETNEKIGSLDLIVSLVKLRGSAALFQSADITFLASLMFGSFGFGATELFRRSFTNVFFEGRDTNSELILLLAATVATIITSAAAAPFELLRVRSMGLVESQKWTDVLGGFIEEKAVKGNDKGRDVSGEMHHDFSLKTLKPKDLLPLFAGFPPTASRELAFAIPKFLAFDVLAKAITGFINAQAGPGSLPIQVGVGTAGLLVSAISGALAGIAGAIVSHPADLILTYTSASNERKGQDSTGNSGADWREVVKDLVNKEGGIANLFVGLPPRLVFFFLVIGLQFFLYDYVKTLLEVGSDDLNLVLDVFYAVRQGLIESREQIM